MALKDIARRILQVTQGRTTAFSIAFFIAGNAFAYFGKLTPTYVYFMATLGGLVLGHSVKEDLIEIKNRALGIPPTDRSFDDK